MSFFRIIFLLAFGWIVGIFSVGFISSLPFPFSEFPFIPIMIAISFVFRARPSMFWFLLIVVAITDLYRTTGFGVGIFSFVILIIIGFRLTSELFTHRSFLGCVFISTAIGILWALCIQIFGYGALWVHNDLFHISGSSFIFSVAIQGCVTGIVVGILYSLLPHWLSGRSTAIINERFV